MSWIKIGFSFLWASLIIFASCKETEKPQPISNTPSIQLLSVEPTRVVALKDSIVFSIQYEDGDGDLGTNQLQNNLFILDSRLTKPNEFRIKRINPSDDKIAIKGTVSVSLKSVSLTKSLSQEEECSFTIWMVDRSGNKSNELRSPTIKILPNN